MRLNMLLILVVSVAALGVSWLLVPRASEQALMLLQSGDLQASKAILERRLADGDTSPSVVNPLERILLAEGDIEAAILLMSRYVDKYPADASAVDHLSELYRQANRWNDYTAAKRRLYRLDGKTESLQDFAAAALLMDDRPARLEALLELERRGIAEPDELLELSQRQAEAGSIEVAARRLQRLILDNKSAVDDLIVIHHSSYAAALQDFATLRQISAIWLGQSDKPDEIAAYLSYLDRLGHRALVLELIAELPPRRSLTLPLAELELAFGAGDRALARLRAEGNLDAAGLQLLFEVALARGDLDLAEATLQQLHEPSADDVLDVMEKAQEAGRADLVRSLAARLKPGEIADRPLLAARLALAQGDLATARRMLAQATAGHAMDFGERLMLGQLMVQAQDFGNGLAVLRSLAEDKRTPAEALADLGNLYFTLARYREGADVMTSLRRLRPGIGIDAAWARLAAKAGDAEAVRRWLGDTQPKDRQLLEDLYFIAGDEKAWPLMIAAAEALQQQRGNAEALERVAEAYLRAGRSRDALAALRAQPQFDTPALADLRLRLRLETGDVAGLGEIVAARVAAPGTSLAVRDDLFGILLDPRITPGGQGNAVTRTALRDLEDAGLSRDQRELRLSVLDRFGPAEALPYRRRQAATDPGEATDTYIDLLVRLRQRDALIAELPRAIERAPNRKLAEQRLYVLLDQGGPGPALPYLRKAANEWGGDWPGAYEAALTQLGRRDDLLALLRMSANDTRAPAARRRDAAFRLLDMGDRPGAEAVFQSLAEQEGPTGQNVQQLLYLWGPRPNAAGLDWLERRARTAPPGQAVAWLDLLRDRGGGARVLASLATDEQAVLADPKRMTAVVEMLMADGQEAAAAEWLNKAARSSFADAARLQHWLDLADRQGLGSAANELSRRLLAVQPQSRETQRQRARIAFSAGRRTEALGLYASYFAAGPGDWESHYNYGELLNGQNRKSDAREHFEAALAILGRQRRPTPAMQRGQAWALARLGRREEAFDMAEKLLAANPTDDLRVDMANLALELGDTRRAERILNP